MAMSGSVNSGRVIAIMMMVLMMQMRCLGFDLA
jgi:hypothetical protein